MYGQHRTYGLIWYSKDPPYIGHFEYERMDGPRTNEIFTDLGLEKSKVIGKLSL